MPDTAPTHLIVAQPGRLTHEVILFAASLRKAAPEFTGKLVVAEPAPALTGAETPAPPTTRRRNFCNTSAQQSIPLRPSISANPTSKATKSRPFRHWLPTSPSSSLTPTRYSPALSIKSDLISTIPPPRWPAPPHDPIRRSMAPDIRRYGKPSLIASASLSTPCSTNADRRPLGTLSLFQCGLVLRPRPTRLARPDACRDDQPARRPNGRACLAKPVCMG